MLKKQTALFSRSVYVSEDQRLDLSLSVCLVFGCTCREDRGNMVRISSHQRGHDPGEAVTREAHRMGHLEDSGSLLLRAVEQNNWTLQFLQLVLDLGVSVVHRHIQ